MTGDWDEKAMFDSPLYPHEGYTTWSWQETFEYWSKRGVPAEKMVFGIPAFGFEFEGATGPGSDFTKGKTKSLSYAQIIKNTNWEIHFDSVSVEPYAVSENSYTTYEDPHSAAIKTRWVKENGYAGIMVWEVSHDYIEGVGNPILDSIAIVLQDGSTRLAPHRTHSAIRMQKTQIKHVDALGKAANDARIMKTRFRIEKP